MSEVWLKALVVSEEGGLCPILWEEESHSEHPAHLLKPWQICLRDGHAKVRDLHLVCSAEGEHLLGATIGPGLLTQKGCSCTKLSEDNSLVAKNCS